MRYFSGFLFFLCGLNIAVAEAADWQRIAGGEGTRCAHDTEFSFWVRPGDPEKLLIYLEGGGGCWDAETCKKGSKLYRSAVTDEEDPARRDGIFHRGRLDNPFRDHTFVFIPSCAGDAFWGDRVVEYKPEEGAPFSVHHKGFANAQAAIRWAHENVAKPESVFVTGCSAGDVGSRVHIPFIIEHYREARIGHLGDSLSFDFPAPMPMDDIVGSYALMPDWMPELASVMKPEGIEMRDYDLALARHYPDLVFARYDSDTDPVQRHFFAARGGTSEGFAAPFRAHLQALNEEVPNFRTYTAKNDMHCVLRDASFYTIESDGVSLRDWTAALEAGQPVESVACEECFAAGAIRP